MGSQTLRFFRALASLLGAPQPRSCGYRGAGQVSIVPTLEPGKRRRASRAGSAETPRLSIGGDPGAAKRSPPGWAGASCPAPPMAFHAHQPLSVRQPLSPTLRFHSPGALISDPADRAGTRLGLCPSVRRRQITWRRVDWQYCTGTISNCVQTGSTSAPSARRAANNAITTPGGIKRSPDRDGWCIAVNFIDSPRIRVHRFEQPEPLLIRNDRSAASTGRRFNLPHPRSQPPPNDADHPPERRSDLPRPVTTPGFDPRNSRAIRTVSSAGRFFDAPHRAPLSRVTEHLQDPETIRRAKHAELFASIGCRAAVR